MSIKLNRLGKIILCAMSATLIAFAITACKTSSASLAGEGSDDGSYKVVADKADEETLVMANFEIPEGCDALVIESDISAGKLHVVLGSEFELDEDSEEVDTDVDPIIEYEATEASTAETFPVEAGFYSISVSGDEDAATGSVTIKAGNK